jgi:predicted nucleotidyltransferase
VIFNVQAPGTTRFMSFYAEEAVFMEKEKINKIRGILKNYELQLLILFGSYESENFNENSDIDLAVKVKKESSLKKNQDHVLYSISKIFDLRPVDLVLLNHADPLIKFKIASEGKLLYQNEKGLFEKFQVRAAAEHNDVRKFYQLDQKFIDNFLERSQTNDRSSHRAPKIK